MARPRSDLSPFFDTLEQMAEDRRRLQELLSEPREQNLFRLFQPVESPLTYLFAPAEPVTDLFRLLSPNRYEPVPVPTLPIWVIDAPQGLFEAWVRETF